MFFFSRFNDLQINEDLFSFRKNAYFSLFGCQKVKTNHLRINIICALKKKKNLIIKNGFDDVY